MGGAATGAAIGGLPGALVGGALGGLGGLFGGSSNREMPGYDQRQQGYMDAIGGAQGRHSQGGQIGGYERSGGGQQFRTGQMDLVRQLQLQASGRGPSLAGMQAQQVAGQSLAQQQAMAAGAGQGNEAMAARQAAMNAGGTMQNLAQTSAQARMAEQMGARQQLAGVLGQGRGMDMQNEQFNAGTSNQRLLEQARMNQQNNQFNGARNDQYEMGLRGMELGQAQSQMGGQTPNTFGTQMMSGGANLLAMYGMGGMGGGGGQQQAGSPQVNAGSYNTNPMQQNSMAGYIPGIG